MKNIIKLFSIFFLLFTSNAFANLYPGKFKFHGAYTTWSDVAPLDENAKLSFYNELCTPIVNKVMANLDTMNFSYYYYNGDLISGRIEGTLEYLGNQIKFFNNGGWKDIIVFTVGGQRSLYKMSSAVVIEIPDSLKKQNIKSIRFSYATDPNASLYLYIITSLVISGSEESKLPFDCYLYDTHSIQLFYSHSLFYTSLTFNSH